MAMADTSSPTERRHKSIDCPISRARVFDCFHDGTRVVAEVKCDKCPATHRIGCSPAWNVASVSDRLRKHDWMVDSEGRNAFCPDCKKPKRERGEIPIGKSSAPPPPTTPPPPPTPPPRQSERPSAPLTSRPLAALEVVVPKSTPPPASPAPPEPAPTAATPSETPAPAEPAVYVSQNAAKHRPDLAPRICARPGCGVTFKPDRNTHVFHNHACARLHHDAVRRLRAAGTAPESTMNAQPNTPEAIRADRLMYQLLDDHYDGEQHRFDEGWSDERVAKESGVALMRVLKCREALYGRPVSAELLKLRQDVNDAIEALKKDKVDLLALVKESCDRNLAHLKDLSARINREIGSDS